MVRSGEALPRCYSLIFGALSSVPSLWAMPGKRLQAGSRKYVRRCVDSKKEDGEAVGQQTQRKELF